MKRLSLLLLIMMFLPVCKDAVKDTPDQNQTYGNTTENTKISAEKIDGSQTYEISFNLEKPVPCITVNIESVYLQKTFPIERIPKKTFFIIEKKLIFPGLKTQNIKYIPMGRNFNNDWELYSPVKICTNNNDPLSILNDSEYRIRFSTFEKIHVYYIITITSESKIVFNESLPPSKKK